MYKKTFSSERIIRQWNRLPRGYAVSTLGAFQDLDPTISSSKQAGLTSELTLF